VDPGSTAPVPQAAPQDLGRKASLVLASQVVGSVVGFVSLLVIGRWFEPAAYGLLVWAWTAMNIISLLADLGFSSAHVHFVGRGTDLTRSLGVYVRIRLALTAAVAGLAVLAAVVWVEVLHRPVTVATTLPILGAVLAMQVVSLLRQVALDTWVGRERVNRSEGTKAFDTALTFLLLTLFGLAQAGAQGRWTPMGRLAPQLSAWLGMKAPWTPAEAGLALAVAYLTAKALSCIPAVWFWMRDRVRVGPWDLALARQYARYALPVVVAGAAATLVGYTDVVMLGLLRTSYDVGQYAVAAKVASVGLIVATSLGTPLLPRFSRLLHTGDDAKARAILHRGERFLLLVVVPMSMSLVALARPILHVAVGDRYLDAANPVRLMALAVLLQAAMTPTGAKIMGGGRSRNAMVGTLLSVFVTAGLNLVLIPGGRFGLGLGATGAALSALVATLMASAYLRVVLKRVFGLPVWDHVLTKMAFAAAILATFWAGALAWFGPGAFDRVWELAGWGLAGCLLFAATCRLLGLLGPDDVRAAWRMANPAALWRELRGRAS